MLVFKGTMITLSICVVLSFSVVGYIIYKDLQEDSKVVHEQGPEVSSAVNAIVEEEGKDIEDERVEEIANLNPFGDDLTPEKIDIGRTQDYIHKMSHQKIRADVKHGFYEITDERIDWLLEAVRLHDFPQKSLYEGILVRWQEGDFSQVVEDHNSIWRLQDGEIGQATGTLSADEEETYIQNNH